MILTVESEEEEESDSSETEKEDDEGIIFVARATSEVLQEGKVSGNALLVGLLPCAAEAGWLVYSPPVFTKHFDSTRNRVQCLKPLWCPRWGNRTHRALEPCPESHDTKGFELDPRSHVVQRAHPRNTK